MSRILLAGFGYEHTILHTALDACDLSLSNHSEVSVIVVGDAFCPFEFVRGMDQVRCFACCYLLESWFRVVRIMSFCRASINGIGDIDIDICSLISLVGGRRRPDAE